MLFQLVSLGGEISREGDHFNDEGPEPYGKKRELGETQGKGEGEVRLDRISSWIKKRENVEGKRKAARFG